MTEGQIKYQTLAENQRHNLEMERLGQQEVDIKEYKKQAEVAQMLSNAADKQSQMEARPWQTAFEGIKAVGAVIKGVSSLLFA